MFTKKKKSIPSKPRFGRSARRASALLLAALTALCGVFVSAAAADANPEDAAAPAMWDYQLLEYHLPDGGDVVSDFTFQASEYDRYQLPAVEIVFASVIGDHDASFMILDAETGEQVMENPGQQVKATQLPDHVPLMYGWVAADSSAVSYQPVLETGKDYRLRVSVPAGTAAHGVVLVGACGESADLYRDRLCRQEVLSALANVTDEALFPASAGYLTFPYSIPAGESVESDFTFYSTYSAPPAASFDVDQTITFSYIAVTTGGEGNLRIEFLDSETGEVVADDTPSLTTEARSHSINTGKEYDHFKKYRLRLTAPDDRAASGVLLIGSPWSRSWQWDVMSEWCQIELFRLYGVALDVSPSGEPITRAQFAQMLCAVGTAAGILSEPPANAPVFQDVGTNETDAAAAAIRTLAAAGIVIGDDTGRFRPEDPLIPGDAAAMIVRALSHGTDCGYCEKTGFDGPYPNGHLTVARDLGIPIDPDPADPDYWREKNNPVSVSDAISYLYLMIDTPLCLPDPDADGAVVETGETCRTRFPVQP